ncbi:unnamed protein product [Clonostachys byssicola]|uniref:Uncharacterized protein n=1 Tax=Clonostachys byssicola TaxID=160290 RepID=A0A9N9TY75_9HYPO|nr:unnamed protein product [Clonostachys byssicola]
MTMAAGLQKTREVAEKLTPAVAASPTFVGKEKGRRESTCLWLPVLHSALITAHYSASVHMFVPGGEDAQHTLAAIAPLRVQ